MEPRKMILLAMFSTLVFVATYINIHIPIGLGTGGLMHLGTLVMFLIALRYGPFYGAWAAGIGMAMFDVLSIWAIWAPGTFVVRLSAGFVIGLLARGQRGQGRHPIKNALALTVGGAIIIAGYFVYEAVFLGVGLAALGSVIGNLVQVAVGFAALVFVMGLPDLERVEGL